MAIRGAKPRPTQLKLVSSTLRPARANPAEPVPTGRPEPPVKMTKRQAELWQRYIVPAWWLSFTDSHAAFMWCCLAAEFEKGAMIAARIAQLRAVSNEIGFNPSARSRLASGPNPNEVDPNEQHFKQGA